MPAFRSWIGAVVLNFAGPAAFSAPEADSSALLEARRILDGMAEKHRSAKTVLIRFESRGFGPDGEPLPKAGGRLLVADSGRFRIEHAQGIAVCDGRVFRQYFPGTRQMIVKNAADAGLSGATGALLRFLEAKPLRAERVREGLRVSLDPRDAGGGLDSLALILDPANSGLRRVETADAAGARSVYSVMTLKTGARFRAGDFSLAPPAGVEIVDMR